MSTSLRQPSGTITARNQSDKQDNASNQQRNALSSPPAPQKQPQKVALDALDRLEGLNTTTRTCRRAAFALLLLLFVFGTSLGSSYNLRTVKDALSVKTKHHATRDAATRRGVATTERKETSVDPFLFNESSLAGLPTWVTKYFQWHRRTREQYPDIQLLTNESAPNVLILYCIHTGRGDSCGGIHDRLGSLAATVYYANQTERVLLLKWFDPMDLENFMLPAYINWTVPNLDRFATRDNFLNDMNVNNTYQRRRRSDPSFVEWAKQGFAQHEKVLMIHHVDTRPKYLVSELRSLGESDTVDNTASFGKIWHAIFRPAPLLQQRLDETMESGRLTAGRYIATHCRVRHPGRFPDGQAPAGRNGSDPDKTGLLWEGPYKNMAVRAAMRAIQCTRSIASSSNDEPIYFFSDSEDLVEYVVRPYQNRTISKDRSTNETDYDAEALPIFNQSRIVSQPKSHFPMVHSDRQVGFPAEAYIPAFVDLYMAINARCVVFGVGNFAFLATKISGTKCALIHEGMYNGRKARMWNQQTGRAAMCATGQ